jgi:hypothetical protein
MAKKQERVPGMTEAKPNREQRRHPDGKPEDQPIARDEQTPETLDVPDPRAKNTGHGKKTADRWNQ